MHLRIRISKPKSGAVMFETINEADQTTNLITGLYLILGGTLKVKIEADVDSMEVGQGITVDI